MKEMDDDPAAQASSDIASHTNGKTFALCTTAIAVNRTLPRRVVPCGRDGANLRWPRYRGEGMSDPTSQSLHLFRRTRVGLFLSFSAWHSTSSLRSAP